jgi:hypothetical protein
MALPQFSRNYGRSGAYENPQTIVDTKSGAIWGNAIQNIGNSIASTIEGISKAASLEVQKTQKILDENAKFIAESYNDFLEQTKKSGVNNESFNNLALDIIRKKGEAYTGMRKGDEKATKDFTIYSSKLNELISLAETGRGAIESYTGDYVDGYSKVNTPGGVSTVGIDPVRSMNYQLAMPAKIGGTKNGKENWYLDDDLNIRTRYTSDQISKNFKEGNIKNDYIDANPLDIYTFDAGVVDDIRKETLKHFNQTGIVKNNVLGDGYIQDTIETIQSGDVEYDYQKIDMAKVTGSTRDFINAKAKTYLKRPSAANNLWNHQLQQGRNILGPDGKPLYPDGFKLKLADGQIGTTFDTETSKVFGEALAQYVYDILPEGKQGSVRKITKDKPTESEIKRVIASKESKANYDIAKKLLEQEGKIPDIPTQPSVFDPSAQLTSESNRFKEAVSAIVTGSNGELVEFVESERTGQPSAKIQYDGQPEIEISLAEFKNKDLFDAKIQKATGAGTSGLETYYDINLD